MTITKITNANQLISGKYYWLKKGDKAIKDRFIEEKPIEARPGYLVPQNMPMSYFMNVTIDSLSLDASTKEDLFEKCKNYGIDIFEQGESE